MARVGLALQPFPQEAVEKVNPSTPFFWLGFKRITLNRSFGLDL